MPNRHLYEIVRDIKKNIGKEAALTEALQELQVWKVKHQHELILETQPASSSSNISGGLHGAPPPPPPPQVKATLSSGNLALTPPPPPTQSPPRSIIPPSAAAGISVAALKSKGTKASSSLQKDQRDFTALTQPSRKAEEEIRRIALTINQTCSELENRSNPLLRELSQNVNEWQQEIQRLEHLKSKLRVSPEHSGLQSEIEQLSIILQENYVRNHRQAQDALLELNGSIRSMLKEVSILSDNLPPRLQVLVKAQLESRIKDPIQSLLIPNFSMITQQLDANKVASLTTKGDQIKTTLLDIMAFDELADLSKIPDVGEPIKSNIEDFISSGKPSYWPDYFEKGIDVNLEVLSRSNKSAYLDKDFVLPFKDAIRLTEKGKTELVREWMNNIPFYPIANDERLYQSLRAALTLSLSEQPLNLEKIEGQDPSTSNVVSFFRLKEVGSNDALVAIDSAVDFNRARLAANYLREIYTSTILAQFDELHQKTHSLQSEPAIQAWPSLKNDALQTIERSMANFKTALFKQRGKIIPDENLFDIFKVMLAPRKVGAKEESIPGFTQLLAELEVQFSHPEVANLIARTKHSHQEISIELQSLVQEYNALEARVQYANEHELIDIVQRKSQLEKEKQELTLQLEQMATRFFKSMPSELKIRANTPMTELNRKKEFRDLRKQLFNKAKERGSLSLQISALEAAQAKLDSELENVPVYEAQSIIEEQERVKSQIQSLYHAVSLPFSIEPQQRPLTQLTKKYQSDIQGFYLQHLFAGPADTSVTPSKSTETAIDSVRDYRGLYFKEKDSITPIAIETLVEENPSTQEELIRSLARIMKSKIETLQDWNKVSIDLDFLSWDEKKALAAFLMPASFNLTPKNFIELQNEINNKLIGSISSNIGMKDLLKIACAMKTRRPGPIPIDIVYSYNAKPSEYYSTEDLVKTYQTLQSKTRLIESSKEATKIQDIPVGIHVDFLSALPAPEKCEQLAQMISQKVLLENFDVARLDNPEYKKLFSSVLETLLEKHATQPDAQEHEPPNFMIAPFATNNDTAQNLRLKFSKYFNAQGIFKQQEKINLMAYFFEQVQKNNINKDLLIGLIQQNLENEATIENAAKELFPVSEILDRIISAHPETINAALVTLERDNENAIHEILNNDKIIDQLAPSSQRAVIAKLMARGDRKADEKFLAHFPAAKDFFTHNLTAKREILSAKALAPFLTGEVARNAEQLFHLQGQTLGEFKALNEKHVAIFEQKVNDIYCKRIIQNALLDPQQLSKLVSILKDQNESAVLNLEIQEFDEFHQELSSTLLAFLSKTKNYGIFYKTLDLDKDEQSAIELAIKDTEEDFLKKIRFDLAKFLVKHASTEHLNQFLDYLPDEEKRQFILDNIGPKPLLCDLPSAKLMELVIEHDNDFAALIDPTHAVERRNEYHLRNKLAQQRQKQLEQSSVKFKENFEKQKNALAQKRLAEDRARILAATEGRLDQEIIEELRALGFEAATPEAMHLLKAIRLLKTNLNTMAIIDVPTQIQEMNSHIFPELNVLKNQIAKLIGTIDQNDDLAQRRIDQGVMTIVARELAESNHLFLSKGQELGAIAINTSGLQQQNAELRGNLEQAKGDGNIEILQLRRELEDAKRQLEKEKQRASIQEEAKKPIEAESKLAEERKLREAAEAKVGLGAGLGQRPLSPIEILQSNPNALEEAIEAHWQIEKVIPDRATAITWLKSAGVKGSTLAQVSKQLDPSIERVRSKHK